MSIQDSLFRRDIKKRIRKEKREMVLPFQEEYRKKYYQLLDEVFDSNFWSDGKMTRIFEEKFQEFTEL